VAQIVTVFGGTGFLGRRIARRLLDKGFSVRIASRRPRPVNGDNPQLQSVSADIREGASIARAVAGAFGAVNAISLYVERGTKTFDAIHVTAAERLADEARRAGVERLVHISGIGSDAQSPSPYIRARGRGERVVRAAFDGATIIRPAVMFGIDDKFLNTLVKLLRRLPVYPMFGRGETRLQPADVEDVGEAVARVLQRRDTAGLAVECGGPRVWSYEELLRTIAHAAKAKPILLPVPFTAWQGMAWIAEMLPAVQVTRSQVELMQIDTVASPDQPGFAALGISPRPLEEVLQEVLMTG
jgi:uncharacterized protein YbjT (DUF2867 family)